MTPRARGAGLVAVGAGLGIVAACTSQPDVRIEVTVPGSLTDEVVWIEVGVFENGCPPDDQLRGGMPASGSIARVAFRAAGGKIADFGVLKARNVGIVATARGEDCSVVAAGCQTYDLTSDRKLTVDMAQIGEPTGGCGETAVCQGARCVPTVDVSHPSVGARCSLDVIGAGPLAGPFSDSETIGHPAIISLDDGGFLIAYREHDVGGRTQITLMPIDVGGGAKTPVSELLADRCSQSDEDDAVGLAPSADGARLVLARPACRGNPGIEVYAVDPTGKVTRSAANQGTGVISLSPRSVSLSADGAAGLVAFRKDDSAAVAGLSALRLDKGYAFGATPPHMAAHVAVTDKLIGLVTVAGEGDSDGGSSGSSEVRLQMVPVGTSLDTLPTPVILPGNWASISAQATRAVVAHGSDDGFGVDIDVFDLNAGTKAVARAASDRISPEQLAKIAYADVVIHQDEMFVAFEQAAAIEGGGDNPADNGAGSISVVHYDHATTAPHFSREVILRQDPRVPSLTRVRDGRIAIAANDSRVGVVWTTARQTSQNDTVGGYAILACRPR